MQSNADLPEIVLARGARGRCPCVLHSWDEQSKHNAKDANHDEQLD